MIKIAFAGLKRNLPVDCKLHVFSSPLHTQDLTKNLAFKTTPHLLAYAIHAIHQQILLAFP